MGTRTLVGHEAGSAKPVWTLFCSADGHAMGRVLDGDEDDAQAFLDWYEPQWGDPRKAEPDALLERQDEWVVLRRDGVAAGHTRLLAAGWERFPSANPAHEWLRPARDGGGVYSFAHSLQLLGEER